MYKERDKEKERVSKRKSYIEKSKQTEICRERLQKDNKKIKKKKGMEREK